MGVPPAYEALERRLLERQDRRCHRTRRIEPGPPRIWGKHRGEQAARVSVQTPVVGGDIWIHWRVLGVQQAPGLGLALGEGEKSFNDRADPLLAR
jgi:hypothetical protein